MPALQISYLIIGKSFCCLNSVHSALLSLSSFCCLLPLYYLLWSKELHFPLSPSAQTILLP